MTKKRYEQAPKGTCPNCGGGGKHEDTTPTNGMHKYLYFSCQNSSCEVVRWRESQIFDCIILPSKKLHPRLKVATEAAPETS